MCCNPSPCQPCDALLSRQTSRSCEQFATPLLLLEFSPGDLAAPSVFGLSVLLFKVRRRRPSTHTPGPPCSRRRCPRLRLQHSFCPRLHPALHAYTRLALHTRVRMPSLAHPLSVDPSYPPLVPSSYPPGTLLVPSCQFIFGPMCGSWMDRADRRLVIRWGIGLQCAGVSLALCTYAARASNLRRAYPRQVCYSRV